MAAVAATQWRIGAARSGEVAPPAPPLTREGLHLWLATLDAPAVALAAWQRLLAPDEHARAGRFRASQDRARYIAGRGLLRQILGRYTGQDPANLRFRYPCACGNPHCTPERRKPTLDPAGAREVPDFSVSHTGGLALYAVARGRPVGVDIEQLRTDLPIAELAHGILCASERAALAALPVARWHDLFFALWTAKEAYLKARGVGLSVSPEGVEVALRDGVPVGFRSLHGSRAEAAHWSLRLLQPAPGYVGAVVAPGRITALPIFAPDAAPAAASGRGSASRRG